MARISAAICSRAARISASREAGKKTGCFSPLRPSFSLMRFKGCRGSLTSIPQSQPGQIWGPPIERL